ncbi:MAG: hypothetical protein KGL42_11865 [Betaproteobacteria bacterium]|nr:hypothetical protein [Betaproteobacteria bacterium]
MRVILHLAAEGRQHVRMHETHGRGQRLRAPEFRLGQRPLAFIRQQPRVHIMRLGRIRMRSQHLGDLAIGLRIVARVDGGLDVVEHRLRRQS